MTDLSKPLTSDRLVRSGAVRVWDRLVRAFHWSLLILFVIAYVSGDRWDDLHDWVGYFIAALVSVRILWGFIGSKHARFKDFIRGPRTTLLFLMDSLRLRAQRYLGHNPAGGAMVITLLTTITVISISGEMMHMDKFWGEQWVEDVHVTAVNVTLVLVALHIAGVLLASYEHKENLIKSMITGWKKTD